jgi:2-haloacid dehalogenase
VHLDQITDLTFDCYGTLIDWETGILNAVVPIVQFHHIRWEPAQILGAYVEAEAAEEAKPYQSYATILRNVMRHIALKLGFTPSASEETALADSVGNWPAFDDTIPALRLLAKRFRLSILSNIDDHLFAVTSALLGVPFHQIITAEQVRSYKPNRNHFDEALRRLPATPASVLHVAQSLYHDHAPAQSLGIRRVWIERPSQLGTAGLAPATSVKPTYRFPDLISFAEWISSDRRLSPSLI